MHRFMQGDRSSRPTQYRFKLKCLKLSMYMAVWTFCGIGTIVAAHSKRSMLKAKRQNLKTKMFC